MTSDVPEAELPEAMRAVLLTGHGGFDMLDVRDDVPLPSPGPDEVLIRVAAAGVNNTDVNTRTGWYSKSVSTGTADGGTDGFGADTDTDGGWSGALEFPRIQGADCCGTIVAVGDGVDAGRIGERVIVRTMMGVKRPDEAFGCWTFGSECDGAFAEYAVAPDTEAFTVHSSWSDAELASIPCAYSTAEGLLHRADVQSGEWVLITGASGGVGSAAVQLARRRGAYVIAVAGASKMADVIALGAHEVVERGDSLVDELGADSVDVVIDVVAGDQFGEMLDVLKRGGRYAVAGAIAGPIVELDVRTLYLKDLTFHGCTFQPDIVFENLVGYIERDEIRPVVAKTYPLADIVIAQQDFLAKEHTGKLVLIP